MLILLLCVIFCVFLGGIGVSIELFIVAHYRSAAVSHTLERRQSPELAAIMLYIVL